MYLRKRRMNFIYILLYCCHQTKALQIVVPIISPNIGGKDIWVPDFRSYIIDLRMYGMEAKNVETLTIELKVCADACLYFTDTENVRDATALYNIYLGAANDYYSGIRVWRNKDASHLHETYKYNKYLDCIAYIPFWFSWTGNKVMFGKGNVTGNNVISDWSDPTPFAVNGIGISTGFGKTGKWKILINVAENFTGIFSKCDRANVRAYLIIRDVHFETVLQCASTCSALDHCLGFNFHKIEQRCELLKALEDTVTNIPLITDAGWNYYTKCYRHKDVCIGCFFDVI